MAADGTLGGDKKHLREKGKLPPVAVLEVTGRDSDGDLVAKPLEWEADDGGRPVVRLRPAERGIDDSDIGIGDRVLARVTRLPRDSGGATHEATPIKKLPREKRRLLGIFRKSARGGGMIEPIDRKELKSWPILPDDVATARDGDLVRFELVRRGRFATPRAEIVESLGNPDDQRQISLIAIHAHGIPEDFPESVLEECKTLPSPTMQGRTDLRSLLLLTIDPVDARDHDDAVHAQADSDPKNSGGWVVTVAIADVAHYIRPGSKIDREAQLRGNSVYFPDRVVPMLPEKISNDLCSLRELEERPCLAVRMIFDRHGEKRSHAFVRAMMRSAAKLSYQEAQAAIDGAPSDKCLPLLDSALKPLWSAYKAVATARDKRGPLDAYERDQVHKHAATTERILAFSPLLAPYATLSARAHERTADLHRGEALAISCAEQHELRLSGEQRIEVALFEILDFGRSPFRDDSIRSQDATSVKHLFTDAQFTVGI